MDSSPSGRWPSASPSRTSRTSTAPPRSRAGGPWSTRGPSLRSTNSWPPHARPATATQVSWLISASSATPTPRRSSPHSRRRSTRPLACVEVATLSTWALRTVPSPWTTVCSLVSVRSKPGWILSFVIRPARRAPAHTVGRDGPRLRRLSHQPRPHRTLFGRDCAACHATSAWHIPEFRHPSSLSMDCAQCHQAPPSHSMEHFHMVSMVVAGSTRRRLAVLPLPQD